MHIAYPWLLHLRKYNIQTLLSVRTGRNKNGWTMSSSSRTKDANQSLASSFHMIYADKSTQGGSKASSKSLTYMDQNNRIIF